MITVEKFIVDTFNHSTYSFNLSLLKATYSSPLNRGSFICQVEY